MSLHLIRLNSLVMNFEFMHPRIAMRYHQATITIYVFILQHRYYLYIKNEDSNFSFDSHSFAQQNLSNFLNQP